MPREGGLGLRAAAARRGLFGFGTTFALAACVGVLGGLGALAFLWLEGEVQRLALGRANDVAEAVRDLPWTARLALPAAGILAAATLTRRGSAARSHDLDVMEAVVLRRGPMRLRSELVRVLSSLGVLGTGGSLGPEGPVVELGAAVGSRFAVFTRERRRDVSLFASCGAAAGLAAAFNAPIGACIFVLEILIGRLSVDRFAPVVIASVVGTTVRHAALGSEPVFHVGDLALVSVWEFVPVVLVGVLGGVAGAIFLRGMDLVRDSMERLRWPWWLRAVVGGAVVGCLGLLAPRILGGGFESVNAALAGEVALGFCLLLLVLKAVATAVTLGAGGLGGVFAPTLLIGALLGAFVGGLVGEIASAGACGPPGAYALLGMGALVGATLHAPVTAILLLFELSRDYGIVPALMTSTMVATVVARRLHPWSLYTQRLRHRGVRTGGAGEIALAAGSVDAFLEPPLLAVPRGTSLTEVTRRLQESHASRVYVLEGDRLAGWFPADALAGVPVDDLGEAAVAEDLAVAAPVLAREASLAQALDILDAHGLDECPGTDGDGRLCGVLSRRAILRHMRSAD